MRRNRIFRSNELSALSPADQQTVAAFGIRLVCDLRSKAERSEFTTLWPTGGHGVEPPSWLELPNRDGSGAGPEKTFALMAGYPDDTGARLAMVETYGNAPEALAATLRVIFAAILRGNALPVLIHCHAGKDRTGFVTAMLLAAIGVAKADIFDDYVTTSLFYPVERESIEIVEWARRSFAYELLPSQAVPLVQARPEYLQAAFEQIDAVWGGVEHYLAQATGLTGTARSGLEAMLLA